MNSKSIHTCESCNQLYCQECSDAKRLDAYCSQVCQAIDEAQQGEGESK